MRSTCKKYLSEIWTALGGEPNAISMVIEEGVEGYKSAFAVSDLAVACFGAVGLATVQLLGKHSNIIVDRRLASLWFHDSIKPVNWCIPPLWDPIAGDYEAADGWIRLHTNAPHHRVAALKVLGLTSVDRNIVTKAVSQREKFQLENDIINAGGCAAVMLTQSEWAAHPQGKQVATEPILEWFPGTPSRHKKFLIDSNRPLKGIRILDLTRVIAGPVATRTLAGLGAEVLRIDPPGWDEPGVLPNVMLGKRSARLDLRSIEGKQIFEELLEKADILVHGYRDGALDNLGYDSGRRQEICPGLIDISLNAYGWHGPWRARRGFDSLVQMSSGIADKGMNHFKSKKPHPLPVQALDHATGYILATAALMGLVKRQNEGYGSTIRTSLAKVAHLLVTYPESEQPDLTSATPQDFSRELEMTSWGPALRLLSPLTVGSLHLHWDTPAGAIGTSEPKWKD